MGFQKAKKEKIWIKVLLGGPSGSGKTYSALRLATGIAKKCDSRIAAIDTENGRIRYYANEFDFDDMQLGDPYTPEKFIEAINDAVDGGYKVLIIDSSSLEWQYLNEVHDKMPGNSFTNWGKLKPRHAAFMEKILQSPLHIINTARGKDEYVLEEKNGKQTPKKVGAGVAQDKDIQYSYSVTFNLDQATNVAECFKDNTHLFEGKYERLTEKDGEALYDWANDGETAIPSETKAPAKIAPSPNALDATLTSKLSELDAAVKELLDAGTDRKQVTEVIKTACGMANFHKIADVDTVDQTIAKIAEFKESIG